jgi:hypothetical protein
VGGVWLVQKGQNGAAGCDLNYSSLLGFPIGGRSCAEATFPLFGLFGRGARTIGLNFGADQLTYRATTAAFAETGLILAGRDPPRSFAVVFGSEQVVGHRRSSENEAWFGISLMLLSIVL